MSLSVVDALALPACICEAESGEMVRYNGPAVTLFGRQPAPRTRIHEVLHFVRPDGTLLEDHEVPLRPWIADGAGAADHCAIIRRPGDALVPVRVDIMPLQREGTAQPCGLLLFRRAAAGRRHDDLPANEVSILEMIAVGAPLPSILNALARAVEAMCGSDNTQTSVGTEEQPFALELADASAWSIPILSAGGKVLGSFRTHFRDGRGPSVTERGRIAHLAHTAAIAIERQHVTDVLIDADRRKDEFVAMLAHELRGPLAPILSAAQLIGTPDASADAAVIDRAGSTIQHHVRQMTRLIDDLLDVSRITHGTMELRKATGDVRDVASHAVEAVRPLMDAREHRLSVSVPDEPVLAAFDATRIEQVIVNLLTNAAKFTRPGGRVALRISMKAETIQIRVTDNGDGIPAPLLPRMFDLFTQGDSGLDRSNGGLGIGLTVVKRVVEMHGGSIEARSEGAGHGSEFTVTLPRGTVEIGGDAPPSARPAERRRILIVEDHRDAGEMLAMLLRMRSHDVRLVSDGYTALAVAPKYRPDVMLIDIGLPGMSGYDLADRIRASRGLANVLLIAVTGYGSPHERNQALSAGFDHHLVKPVEEEALAALLG